MIALIPAAAAGAAKAWKAVKIIAGVVAAAKATSLVAETVGDVADATTKVAIAKQAMQSPDVAMSIDRNRYGYAIERGGELR